MKVTKKSNGKIEVQNHCCRELLKDFDETLDIEVLNRTKCPYCKQKINFLVEEECYDRVENM